MAEGQFSRDEFCEKPKDRCYQSGAGGYNSGFRKEAVDLVIMLLGAFTGDFAATLLAEELKVPVILWAPMNPHLTEAG